MMHPICPHASTRRLPAMLMTIMVMVLLTSGCSHNSDDDRPSARHRANGGNSGSDQPERLTPDPLPNRQRSDGPFDAEHPVTIDLSAPPADIVAITPEAVEAQTDTEVITQAMLVADDRMSRRQAARELGRRAGYEAIPALLVALEDEDLTVRSYAISAISDICGMRFNYDPDAPVSSREAQIESLKGFFRRAGIIE